MVAGGNAQAPGHSAGEVAHRLFRRFQLLLYRPGVRQQRLSRLGQADIAPDAVEQAGPQLVLEQGYPFADRGLGQVKLFRRQRERAALRHQHEGPQVLGVHFKLLSDS